MAQKSWEARVRALAAEAADGLRFLAGPVGDGDKVKARIQRAARAAGLTYWRAFDLWYGKARRVAAEELEAIRTARAKRARERADEMAAVAADLEAIAERVARLGAQSDRDAADALRDVAGRARRLAS